MCIRDRGYVEDVFEPRTKLEGRFSMLPIKKASAPGQGRRPCELRGTTLIQRGMKYVLHPNALHSIRDADHSEPITTLGGFTSPAQRRVRQITGWFAPSTSSLSSVSAAYYSSSSLLLLSRIEYRRVRFRHRLPCTLAHHRPQPRQWTGHGVPCLLYTSRCV